VPSLCPKSYAHGPLSSGKGFFLATDFLNLGGLRSKVTSRHGSGLSLAAKLAKLHSSPAPIPDGHQQPQFGFPVPTCCGSTVQPNNYASTWAAFFANSRLRAIARSAEGGQGADAELQTMVEKMAANVVPKLLADGHLRQADGKPILPVVVHGDLWSGNHGTGAIGNRPVEEVVFDPSSCYGHSEYELGIMRMFGGYGESFFREYHEVKPKDEPVAEYEDRMELYKL
jgi:protein-ribulosamine 3-kinase